MRRGYDDPCLATKTGVVTSGARLEKGGNRQFGLDRVTLVECRISPSARKRARLNLSVVYVFDVAYEFVRDLRDM